MMLNVGGSITRQGPLVRGLTIAFNLSGKQTTFVQRLVLLIWLSRGGLEGWRGWWSKLRGEGVGSKSNLLHHPCCHWVPAHTSSPTSA